MFYEKARCISEWREKFQIVRSPNSYKDLSKDEARELIRKNGYILVHENSYGKIWEASAECPFRKKYGTKRKRQGAAMSAAPVTTSTRGR